jgi:Glycosyl transferase family 2
MVSVVIPAYNQARFLGDTIRSVLSQTYRRLEAIVVNDASDDETESVVRGFEDPRLRYIEHERNAGLPATRNTGIAAASGQIVALLDADDLFHPEKLDAHVALLTSRADVDVSYNARFELNHSATTVREIWQPPPSVELLDLMRGFPFAPSDMVVRRAALVDVGLFNPRMGSAEDTDLPCRLALAGYRFAGLDRVLNSRRYHSGRGRKHLLRRRDDVARALDAVRDDPRCPADARHARATAMTHHLMVLVSLALLQAETDLARVFADELLQCDASVLQGQPSELMSFLMMESVADNALDHEMVLREMLDRLPPALAQQRSQQEWAVARGYLWKGLRNVLWDRMDPGRVHLARAAGLHAEVDTLFTQFVTSQLLNFEMAFGQPDARAALERVADGFRMVGGARCARQFKASVLVNQAFRRFHSGDVADVPRTVATALLNDPSYLTNRGVLAMTVRSMVGQHGRAR